VTAGAAVVTTAVLVGAALVGATEVDVDVEDVDVDVDAWTVVDVDGADAIDSSSLHEVGRTTAVALATASTRDLIRDAA
jgi:hypothetical protein